MGIGVGGSKDHEEAALAEVARWPGASIRFEPGNKHAVGYVSYGGKTQKAFYPTTASDVRGPLNFASNVRHILIGMGASPKPKNKTSGKIRRKNKITNAPLPSVQPISREDRWLERLQLVKDKMDAQK